MCGNVAVTLFFSSKVCCPDSSTKSPHPTTTKNANLNVFDPQVPNKPPIDSFTVLSDLLPTAQMCKANNDDRIVGGKKANEDEFPWMALLEYNKRNNNLSYGTNSKIINSLNIEQHEMERVSIVEVY